MGKGKPDQFDGKNPWVSCEFSQQNQSSDIPLLLPGAATTFRTEPWVTPRRCIMTPMARVHHLSDIASLSKHGGNVQRNGSIHPNICCLYYTYIYMYTHHIYIYNMHTTCVYIYIIYIYIIYIYYIYILYIYIIYIYYIYIYTKYV